jgi:hypothetical protein
MKHRYDVVLALIVALLVFQMSAPDRGWSRAVAIVLEGLVLVAVFHASDVHPALRRISEGGALLGALAAAITLIGVDNSAPDAFRVINVALIGIAPPVIAVGVLRAVREHEGVTLPAVTGVLCIYLLFGMIFASAYGAIAAISGNSFFVDQQPDTISNYLYFSYTTLTTTGYGDLTPAGNLARSFAIVEQLVGAMYLVTVVAVLVSNLRPRRA